MFCIFSPVTQSTSISSAFQTKDHNIRYQNWIYHDSWTLSPVPREIDGVVVLKIVCI